MPKIPLPVRDLDVFDLSGIEADVWLTTNLSYDAVINDGNVIDHLSVAQRDSRHVIAHAGLWLSQQDYSTVPAKSSSHLTKIRENLVIKGEHLPSKLRIGFRAQSGRMLASLPAYLVRHT
jgi:hypothetical protein